MSAADLLDVWERGQPCGLAERGLLLLGLATGAGNGPTATAELSRVPLGRRDNRLLALRQRLFGDRLSATSPCLRCGESMEWALAVDDLRGVVPENRRAFYEEAAAGEVATNGDEVRGPGSFVARVGGYEIEARVPATADLLAVSGLDQERARAALLERCLVRVWQAGAGAGEGGRAQVDVDPRALLDGQLGLAPGEMAAVLAQGMCETDPLSDLEIGVACAACGGAFSVAFDIVSYLWTELSAWALRTLREVHALASAYGWTEREILALGARRRRSYLDLVGA